MRILIAIVVLLTAAQPSSGGETLQVYAAASLQPALDEVLAAWHPADGATAHGIYAASSLLARQIEQGAPADLFLSADERWMDDLQRHGLVKSGSRMDLLGNRLVLIAPAGHAFTVSFVPAFNLLAAFPGRLATTDSAVPLGHYAQEAFVALGWNAALSPRFLPAENAMAALRLVELGEADAGVAYANDAAADAKVSVIGEIPESLHSPIRYPLAMLAASQAQSPALWAYLQSAPAKALFAKDHLIVLPGKP